MKTLISLIMAILPASAFCGPINLEPMSNGKLSIESAENFTGRCGAAIVRVLGVQDATQDSFRIGADNAAVLVRDGSGRELVLRHELGDLNKVDCVRGNGLKIVIGTQCSGSACPDVFSYIVIDTKTLRVTTPSGGVPLEKLKPYL